MKKDIKFSTRMASEDREKIRALAQKAGMSMSDYVTACCLGKRIVIMDSLKEVLRQQKAIGNNLNQLSVLGTWARCSLPIWTRRHKSLQKSMSPCGRCRKE